MSRYELTDDVLAAFPDEREALRGLAAAVARLVANLRLGDEPIEELPPYKPNRKERKAYEARQKLPPDTLGWKNEFSASSLLDIEGKWLPLARVRLGLDSLPEREEAP